MFHTKKIFSFVLIVALSGCAELSTMLKDPEFVNSLTSLNSSLKEYNDAKNNNASHHSTPTPAPAQPATQYTERPCESLTVQTKDYTNALRRAYPDSNSNTAQQCALSRAMRAHLTNQKAAAASCDKSGAYRSGLTQTISNYDQLISQLSC